MAQTKTEEGRARMDVMIADRDGFKIAEEEDRRRPGACAAPARSTGTRQSGNAQNLYRRHRTDMEIDLNRNPRDRVQIVEADPTLARARKTGPLRAPGKRTKLASKSISVSRHLFLPSCEGIREGVRGGDYRSGGLGWRVAVDRGSFDPVTNGHLEHIPRAATILDERVIVVAAARKSSKTPLFSLEEPWRCCERVALRYARGGGRFEGLLCRYAWWGVKRL